MSHDYIDIVFDGPPGLGAGRFIEVEDPNRKSVRVGKWVNTGGYWRLRIPRQDKRVAALEAEVKALRAGHALKDSDNAHYEAEKNERIVELEAEIEQLRRSPWPPEEIAMKTRAQLAMGLAVASNRIAKLEDAAAGQLLVEAGLRKRIAAMEKEVAWWAGEGQDDRPEMIEWRKLTEMSNRTAEQTKRMGKIAQQMYDENAEAPELRKRIDELEGGLQALLDSPPRTSEASAIKARNAVRRTLEGS